VAVDIVNTLTKFEKTGTCTNQTSHIKTKSMVK